MLKTRETQEYPVYTIGNKKPKKITSLVELTIKGKKGDDILIKASIVPQIRGLVQRIPINIPEQQNQRRYITELTLPSTSANTNFRSTNWQWPLS